MYVWYVQNVFSYCRMCSLTVECVLLHTAVPHVRLVRTHTCYRMCSLTTVCVLTVECLVLHTEQYLLVLTEQYLLILTEQYLQ